jgi:hypothetical protein
MEIAFETIAAFVSFAALVGLWAFAPTAPEAKKAAAPVAMPAKTAA